MEHETWKEIPSIEGALASTLGRIRMPSKFGVSLPSNPSRTRDYITKPTFGYPQKDSTGRDGSPKRMVTVWRGKNYKIHRLVCEAFHGQPPSKDHIVLHLNENPGDNRPENLRWGTRKENQNFPKVKEAFRARVGEKSSLAIYSKRVAIDPKYKPKSKRKV